MAMRRVCLNKVERVREQISEAYGSAVTRQSGKACCGDLAKSSACDIGYSEADLALLPEGAADTSFGCGNPLALIDIAPGETVVDLGSGAGLDLLIAAHRVGPTGRVIGIDMTGEMIAQARRNILAAGLENAEIREGVIEDLPIESGSVDLVISNCVINLSTDKDQVFSEIARVLKPGGRIQVSDIVLEEKAMPAWLEEERDLHAELYSACIAGAISETAYLEGLSRAGLIDAEIRERIPYGADDIRGFIDSGDAPVNLPAGGSARGVTRARVDELIAALTGKVWSAKVFARKPLN